MKLDEIGSMWMKVDDRGCVCVCVCDEWLGCRMMLGNICFQKMYGFYALKLVEINEDVTDTGRTDGQTRR